MNYRHLIIACALSALSVFAWAGENKKDSVGYQFTVTKELKTNPVKDQSRSGTCWSFSTLSFIEDDLLRQGKPSVDLSEMFVVRNDYIEKAIKYVRMHGSISFSAGGSAYDVLYIIDKYGIVPEEVYTGLNYGTDKPPARRTRCHSQRLCRRRYRQPQQETLDGLARWLQGGTRHLSGQSAREVYLQRGGIHAQVVCRVAGHQVERLYPVDLVHAPRFLQALCHRGARQLAVVAVLQYPAQRTDGDHRLFHRQGLYRHVGFGRERKGIPIPQRLCRSYPWRRRTTTCRVPNSPVG